MADGAIPLAVGKTVTVGVTLLVRGGMMATVNGATLLIHGKTMQDGATLLVRGKTVMAGAILPEAENKTAQ